MEYITYTTLERISSLPFVLMCTADKSGYLRSINLYFKELLGYSDDELAKLQFINLVHHEDIKSTLAELDYLFSGKVVVNFENRIQNKSGTYHWVQWISQYDSHSNLVYSIGKDITDQKNTQRQLDFFRKSKDKLFSILAHDLKGTLSSIITLVKLVQDDLEKIPETAGSIHSLQLIADTAHSTNDLLQNQLNWFYIQLKALEPVFEKIHISHCINNAISIYKSTAASKGIEINYSPTDEIIEGDGNLLCIVFRNLISNAIKFSLPDSPLAIRSSESEDGVTVQIEDHGIGIPDEIKKDLFNPDHRPVRQGTKNEQSTGLGLLLCQEIITLHYGHIQVESGENGTTVFVRLLKKPSKEVALQNSSVN